MMGVVLLLSVSGYSQSYTGFSIATSKSDKHMEMAWFQHQVSQKFSVGAQLKYSEIDYRFINARAVEEGNTFFSGLTLGYNIASTNRYRLDFNLTASYRYLSSDQQNAVHTSTGGIEIDPNIIFGVRLSESLMFHTGPMLRTAHQISPDVISDEQLISTIVLSALSYELGCNLFSLRTYVGPMNGATGDTEKFFWQVSLGYQYQFGSSPSKLPQSLPFFNF